MFLKSGLDREWVFISNIKNCDARFCIGQLESDFNYYLEHISKNTQPLQFFYMTIGRKHFYSSVVKIRE